MSSEAGVPVTVVVLSRKFTVIVLPMTVYA
jgi:hypothetical protein